MNKKNGVQKLATALYLCAYTGIGVTLISSIYGIYISLPLTAESLQAVHSHVEISKNVTQSQLWAVTALGVLPAFFGAWILFQMGQLFDGYRQGKILTDRSALLIQRIGLGFLCVAITKIALAPISTVLLTMANGQGERSISLAIGTDILSLLFAAGFVTVIGWAMREASAADAENKAFI